MDPYKETIKVYSNLGVKYLRDTSKVAPVDRSGFMQMLPKGSLILDAGCAGGRDAKVFVKKGFRVVGIDLVDVFLKQARKSVPKANFIKMDVRKLKFPRNHFNAVWAHAILIHLSKRDAAKALKKLHSIMKLGGVLHVRVKCGKGSKFVSEDLTGQRPRMFTFFSKQEMEKLVEDAGFRITYSAFTKDELKRKNVKWIMIRGRKI